MKRRSRKQRRAQQRIDALPSTALVDDGTAGNPVLVDDGTAGSPVLIDA